MNMCDECGLLIAECNAWVNARNAAEESLRNNGYRYPAFKERAALLVPDNRKQLSGMAE